MKLATLCYIKSKGKTLMLHRIKKKDDMHEGKWVGLGGKIEPAETPEECVIREVREECGLILKNPLLRGVLTFPAFDDIEDWYVFVFVAREFEGNMRDSTEGTLRWVDDQELLQLNQWVGDKIFQSWLDKEGFFSGRFVYENDKLVHHDVAFYN